MSAAGAVTGAAAPNQAASAGDVALVTQVVLAERQGRDRGWWPQMAAMYWPDSTVRLSWYNGDGAGFVAGSEVMARRGAVALHHMFTPAVHVRGDRAYVEAPAAMRFRVEVGAVPGDLVS
ncbi:MAG: nuclear transport factor 2 family protein, partial [Solirubrobacteraceae bacterium]